MEIINLTPHPITVTAGEHAGTYPSVGIARVDGLPLGPVVGLHPPTPDTLFVVSVIVAEAAPERTDLRVPGEQVRDASGRIVGCASLALPEDCSPALARERTAARRTASGLRPFPTDPAVARIAVLETAKQLGFLIAADGGAPRGEWRDIARIVLQAAAWDDGAHAVVRGVIQGLLVQGQWGFCPHIVRMLEVTREYLLAMHDWCNPGLLGTTPTAHARLAMELRSRLERLIGEVLTPRYDDRRPRSPEDVQRAVHESMGVYLLHNLPLGDDERSEVAA